MNRKHERSFGQVIRERRRQLEMTQQDVSDRIKTSTPYVGLLEAGKRHPSGRILSRLAEVLGFERRELFFLANPDAVELLAPNDSRNDKRSSAWEAFRHDDRVRRRYNISSDEMEMLSRVALMGEINSARDFIYILNAVRHALGR
ncbi:MAG TPA: helix-turn-helix domain-containing protein [Candidatus Binataceae bacterium]|nr:helix-turn-helix domain-containing protein [Candidatus Binataceae bacterium]